MSLKKTITWHFLKDIKIEFVALPSPRPMIFSWHVLTTIQWDFGIYGRPIAAEWWKRRAFRSEHSIRKGSSSLSEWTRTSSGSTISNHIIKDPFLHFNKCKNLASVISVLKYRILVRTLRSTGPGLNSRSKAAKFSFPQMASTWRLLTRTKAKRKRF